MTVDNSMFHPDQLPFTTGLTALVTGANSGLGYFTALHLYMHGCTVYMACRDLSRAENAADEIRIEAEKRRKSLPEDTQFGVLKVFHLDLGSLEGAHVAAKRFLESEGRLDLLINNAGVMALPAETTCDGYDIQIQTNHVSPFLFTKSLMPRISESEHARVVFVSSVGHYLASPGVDLSGKFDYFPNILWTWFRYGNSKAANIHTVAKFSDFYPDVTSIAVHPGFALLTNLLSYWVTLPIMGTVFRVFFYIFHMIFGVTPEEGSFAILKVALSPDITSEDSGKYYITFGKEATPSRRACSPKLIDQTWSWTEAQLRSKGYE